MQVLRGHVKYSVVKNQAGGTIVVTELEPGDSVDCIVIADDVLKRTPMERTSAGSGRVSIPFELQASTEKLALRVYKGEAETSNWANVRLMLLEGQLVAVERIQRCTLVLEDCTN